MESQCGVAQEAPDSGLWGVIWSAAILLLLLSVISFMARHLWGHFKDIAGITRAACQRAFALGRDPWAVELEAIRIARRKNGRCLVKFGSIAVDSDVLCNATAVATPQMADLCARNGQKLGPTALIVAEDQLDRAVFFVEALGTNPGPTKVSRG